MYQRRLSRPTIAIWDRASPIGGSDKKFREIDRRRAEDVFGVFDDDTLKFSLAVEFGQNELSIVDY